MLFKKRASYLSGLLLTLPLVAATDAAASADLRPLLEQLPQHCAPLPTNLDDNARQQLRDFYAQRENQPAWADASRRRQLAAQLAALADDGLEPDEYALPAYDGPCSELLHSHSYLQALLHLRRGRLPPPRQESLWHSPANPLPDLRLATLSLALLHLQAPAEAFAAARPAGIAYRRLRAAYAELRQRPLADWQPLADGPLLKAQRRDARVPALRERLRAEGYLSVTTVAGEAFDPATVLALQAFQDDHGLNPDGILGPASLAELNVAAPMRRAQLRINLERLRWLADDLAATEVLINVAAAELLVLREQRVLWRTRTQVGRAGRETPLLASRIQRLTLNPTWTVPPTILREDKLPAIRDDLAYLAQQELSVLDRDGQPLDPELVDWDNPGAIVLRQAAGTRNPLGRVALRFANPFAVYLHDTPSQRLFDKSPRVFSSGCVRVEAVGTLLAWLLRPQELEPVQQRIASGKTQEYRLQQPVPLLIAYWTVEARSDGTLRYAPDIYARDAQLIAALAIAQGLSAASQPDMQRAIAAGQ